MSVFGFLSDDPAIHVECRNCGRNLPADADACPDCDGTVVTYEL